MRLATFVILLVLLCVGVTYAQTCEVNEAFIQNSLREMSQICQGLGRNQICHGNDNIEVSASFGVSELNFEDIGDIEDIDNIAEINLLPLTLENPNWATALMNAQAVLPNTLPGQNITFLLFGDVELIPTGVDSDGLRAFTFSTGIGRTLCNEVNLDGMFVQTGSSPDRQLVNINGARVELSSLAFISTPEDNNALFQISMMNGHSWVNVGESPQKDIGTGQQLTVYESGPADPVGSAYVEDQHLQTIASYVTEVYGHCTLSNSQEITFPVRVGPGFNRAPALLLPVGEFTVIGRNTESGQTWWRINKSNPLVSFSAANELWVLDDPSFIWTGDCENVADLGAPPIIAPAVDPIEYHPTNQVIGESTEEPFYARIGSFWSEEYYLYYDTSFYSEVCTYVHWTDTFGGYGAELYVQNLYTSEYWPVTADETGSGSHYICLAETTEILLYMFAPNATNGDQQATITIYVNE